MSSGAKSGKASHSEYPLIRSPTSPTRRLRHAKSRLDSVPFLTNFSQTLVSLGLSEVAQSYSRVPSHPIPDLRINDLGKRLNAWLGWTRTRFPGLIINKRRLQELGSRFDFRGWQMRQNGQNTACRHFGYCVEDRTRAISSSRRRQTLRDDFRKSGAVSIESKGSLQPSLQSLWSEDPAPN